MSEQATPPGDADETVIHSYDGIQEFDNPTPGWWDLLFVATVIFGPIYALWFHAPLTNRNLASQYEANLAANMRLQFGEIGDLTADEQTILQYMDEEEWLKVGAATFATNCVSCHGRGGEGISGPNLTDDEYIHVKQVADIAKVVANGAKNGAMPAWANRLHPNEVVLVSAYVASLRGQNLPGKYGGESGKEIAPWPAKAVSAPSQDAAGEAESSQASRTTTALR
ncbi:MAG: cbb3-type cytochrome c oxidase N-terminal domain-containing protein [Planctomycetota bacterium]